MQADTGELRAECRADSGAKARLLTLADLDGRTLAARQVKSTIESLVVDLGGPDNVSTGEQQIVKRAALVGAMLEDLGVRWLSGESVDPALFATLANAERRLLETVGLRRRARDVSVPSLEVYLRATQATEKAVDAISDDGRTDLNPSTEERASESPTR